MVTERYKGTPTPVANYSWLELTSGLGYRTYYGACAIADGGTRHYFLTQRLIDSTSGIAAANVGSYTPYTAGADADIDFDITFGVPSIVGGGDAFVNVTNWIRGTSGAECQITATVRHVAAVGGAETGLGSFVHLDDDSAADKYHRDCLKIAVTEKKFGVGDILRLNISANNQDTVYIYHDPSSSLTFVDGSTRTIGSDLTFDCPFRVIL